MRGVADERRIAAGMSMPPDNAGHRRRSSGNVFRAWESVDAEADRVAMSKMATERSEALAA
jgi:hypothetical protein